MSQTLAKKILVVGGSGFLGSNICRLAVNKGWETISLSRGGESKLIRDQQNADWVKKVKWVAGDSLQPETYRDILEGVTNVVHSVGILMENDYKQIAQSKTLCEAVGGIQRMAIGMKDRGNPLDPHTQDKPHPTYETMNRDTAISIADEVAKLPTIESFVYISASDILPFIDPRYITTKREAEYYLFRQEKFKTIVLRPGLMYSNDRPSVLPAVKMIQGLKAITSPFKDGLSSLPGGKLITTNPLNTETVARATVAAIEANETGIFDVDGIEKLSRFH